MSALEAMMAQKCKNKNEVPNLDPSFCTWIACDSEKIKVSHAFIKYYITL